MALQLEIIGKNHVAADVGEHGQRSGGNDGAADGKSVETVGKVNSIGRADQDKHDPQNEGNECEQREMRNRGGPVVPKQIGPQRFNERHRKVRGEHLELIEGDERGGNQRASQALPEQLCPCREAEAAAIDHFDVVIGKANGAEGKRGENRDPDEGVRWIGPERGGQQDGDADQHAAHGGRAGFFQVRLRPIVTHKLADLELMKLLNDVRADEERNEQRGERGKHGAKGEVAEDPEWVKERKQLFVEQPVKQEASVAGLRREFRMILQGGVTHKSDGAPAGKLSR
jgi:hypothetical protein